MDYFELAKFVEKQRDIQTEEGLYYGGLADYKHPLNRPLMDMFFSIVKKVQPKPGGWHIGFVEVGLFLIWILENYELVPKKKK